MVRSIKISSLLVLLLQTVVCAQNTKDSYSPSSVLASGQWFKIAVVRDGIYRIGYSELIQLGLQNPSNPKIFANNFGQLSYFNNDTRPDDLTEIAIFADKGTDGIFNNGDFLYFYGQGTGRWKYNDAYGKYDYIRHNYSDTAFYFLTSGSSPGKGMTVAEEIPSSPDYYSSESDALFIHEVDDVNLIKSGREWYQIVPLSNGVTINPAFKNLLITEKINYEIRVLARAPVNTLFRFYEGTETRQNIQVQRVNMFDTDGTQAQISDSTGSFYPLSSSPTFTIKFFKNEKESADGWLDYVKLQGRKSNNFASNTEFYTDARAKSAGRITQFAINCPSGNPLIWDITDSYNPERVQYNRTGNIIIFKSRTDNVKSFVSFIQTNAIHPVIRATPLNNQNLHGSGEADMIILTHTLFRKFAEKLAEMHSAESGLISQIVTTNEIYNEFSGGTPDIVAIRNFLRMKYLRQSGSAHPLKYLLLFGDGSYENRTLPPNNPNFIPTYQSQNSNVVVSSFTSDDFYGLLEDGEGEAMGTEDLGIGRLPVSDTTQAGILIRKIARYMSPSNTGSWKNIICITADDGDGNAHMFDAEGLALLLKDSVPSFNVDKIYLDAFRQVTTASGQTYPDVVTAINNRINSGCLIFNYIGHGNEIGLADEGVVKTKDIRNWNNGTKLPLFITATCEFSRFDDIEINIATGEMINKTSAGEMILLNENGGGIALMSTTRVVYSAPNYFLNQNIYDAAFDNDKTDSLLRLGDIIRIAKNKSGSSSNKRNFSLLGDPAIRLAYPWHGQVITDSINHVSVTSNPDSLKALTQVTVSGHIENNKGEELNNFNGIVSPVVFDKASSIKTLANDGGQTMKFDLMNNVIFSGKTTALNGKFKFTFIVPRDIDYTYGNGKISYYANDTEQDMGGYFSDIIVGGFANSNIADSVGPFIRLFMNDTLFRNGGLTDNNPRMLAIIEDKGGINTTGSGIGHDLVAYLDNNHNNSFVLNNYFENDFDNYMKGKITYDFSDLAGGNHSLTLKAWDNFNNSSEQTILFVVETNGKFVLKNLINYPNPVLDETKITAEHNRPDEQLVITISIFDMSGRIIKIIRTSEYSAGYQLPPVIWDGNSDGGKRVTRGIYPYRVSVRTESGETALGSGRMIIL